MKKVIILVVGLMALSRVSFAQVTSFDHDKYWYYRWRLTHLFLHKGLSNYSCQDPYNLESGHSIPAGNLDPSSATFVPEDVLSGINANPHWGDGTSFLGWYIAVLATEWRLLKNQTPTQSTTAVEEELFYAMKAYERLDQNAGILFAPNQARPQDCSAPDGFFGRDDVSIPFIKRYFPNATKAISDFSISNTDPTTGTALKNPQNVPVEKTMAQQGVEPKSGAVYATADQIADLFVGFALVKKCLDGNTNYNGYNFKEQAGTYTTAIGNSLKGSNYKITDPITNQVVAKAGYIDAGIDAYPLSKAAERIVSEKWGDNNFTNQFDNTDWNSATNATSSIWLTRQSKTGDSEIIAQGLTGNEYMLGYRHELAAVGHSWQLGATPVKCFSVSFCFFRWCASIDFWRYDLNVDPNGLDGLINSFDLLKKLSCVPFELPNLTINSTGYTLGRQGDQFETQIFALLHQYLHGGNNSIDDSFYRDAINSAPCVGPHYFPNTSNYQGVPGWRSSQRWQKRISAFIGGENNQVFNGLDYMLLYNLWALEHPDDIKVNYRDNVKVSYRDELNPVYNFSGASVSGKYIGFESINITGTATSSTGATFLSPNTRLNPGTKLTSNITISAPTNGVSLQCDASGNSFSRVAATKPNVDAINKQYAQDMAKQLEPQIQKVSDEFANHKYVPIKEYVKKGPTTHPKETSLDDSPVKLYPNPSSGAFTLSSENQIVEVTIQTVLGEPVVVKKMDTGATVVSIDATNLSTGTYLCIIQTTDGVVVKKWIKK